MKFNIKMLLIGLSVVAVLSGCSTEEKKQQTHKSPPPLHVETITIEKQDIPIWFTYTGKTKASSTQEIRARVSGILQKRYFQDGEYVHKGQKLFKIQPDEYIAALQAAKAQKAQDEAALKLAQADVERYKPLVQEGLAPRATLEQYESKLEALKAAIIGDKAKIAQAQLNLDYTTIKAPISGKISARYVDVGNLIMNGNQLLTTITQTDPIYAYFSPSNDDYMMFQKHKEKAKTYAFIELKSSVGNIREDGYVDFADNMVDPLTSTINMRAVIQNKAQKILPGTFVYVNIYVTTTKNFKVIPPEIIFNDQLGKFVYIVDKNNTLKRVDIQTGYSNYYYVNALKGLNFGDKVVVSSLMKLKPGLHVTTTDVTATKGIDAILQKHKLLKKEEIH